MVYYIIGSLILIWMLCSIVRHRRRRGKVVRVIEENCTGCKRCLKKCRHNVLESVQDEYGTHIIVRNPNKCTACSDCVSACKFKALEICANPLNLRAN
jgi:ferredoxin